MGTNRPNLFGKDMFGTLCSMASTIYLELKLQHAVR